MILSFRAFWWIALASNVAAGAQGVAVAWYLGDENLPASVLVAFQLSSVVSGLFGIATGSAMARRLGPMRTVSIALLLEASLCVAVAFIALAPHGAFDAAQAYATALTAGAGISFAAGVGGPSWVAIVSRWPGSTDEKTQLLRDNAQFQLGRFVGPLIGGWVLVITVFSVQWLAAVNALSFVMVAWIFWSSRLKGEAAPATSGRSSGRSPLAVGKIMRDPAVWAFVTVAMTADTIRTFLPRLIRLAGEPEWVFVGTLALLALSAAAGGALSGRFLPSDRVVAAYALLGITLSIATWSAAVVVPGPTMWMLGGAFMGISVALVTVALTKILMDAQPAASRARGAALAMGARTVGSAAGGVIAGATLALFGGLTFVPFAVLPVLAALALRARKSAHVDGDGDRVALDVEA
ncbi:MFS transporter [Cellulomonas xiejunii]|uniref:MFS transporter n=1 Tax=Cellulomonas xiejunii TaxID=2968083 RepID=UPI001D0F04CD|nr:MFS transporter [Cellulomonas xiejunii]MCC2314163.1 MFS transporter [Cellulomonas xiejunii]